MLVAALAAAVAATLAANQSQWTQTVALRRDQVQAQSVVLAGLSWARQIVALDARAGPIDHLGEPWALPLPPTPLENGSVEGRIVDAQGRINLNDLAHDGVTGQSTLLRLARLFGRVGLPVDLLPVLADWIDADDVARERGGESAAYAERSLAPPNAPLLRSAEAAAVPGIDGHRLAALGEFVTALPTTSTVNVNTAPVEVLAAIVNGVDAEGVAALVADRARKPFSSVADFRARLPSGASVDEPATLGVRSEYFLVTVLARQGPTLAQGRALLRRRDGEAPQVVWQTIE